MPAPDPALQQVRNQLLDLDPFGRRFANSLRRTFDQLYDGQRTGRYKWEDLLKTEKSHFGTLIEIALHREFEFDDGQALDYRICGYDVDCKYSQSPHGWMIPPEAINQICLVVWANDRLSRWSAGLLRPTDHILGRPNRDNKRSILQMGYNHISWIFENEELPPNILLHIPQSEVDAIFSPRYGARRINELFRRVLNQRITRGVVATVAQQADYMKRVRANRGARDTLRDEGIVILGDYQAHKEVARRLGATIPGEGEFVSLRLARADIITGSLAIELEGNHWSLASSDSPPVIAPRLPTV